MLFEYSDEELNFLKQKDKRLKALIEQTGKISQECEDDLLIALLGHIVSQQITNQASKTIWTKLALALENDFSAEKILSLSFEKLKACGLSQRKVFFILDLAQKIQEGKFSIDKNFYKDLDDETVIKILTELNGVGRWTAEMVLLFCFQRKNILSFGDFAIKKGLCLLYHHKELRPELFARYKKRFSPYGSIASFYLWHLANGERK